MQIRLFFIALLTSLHLMTHAQTAITETGVSNQEIKIGMANALTGPAAGLGNELKNGALAYLDKVNRAGGVNGRRITLVSVDDGYEPDRTATATTKLIETEKVFALFGYVGTPTSSAAVPIAAKAGVPFLFPFTGAEFLRTPVNPYVFNLRASYFDETEQLVERLTKDLSTKKIALFIQDDSFGEAGKAGVQRALGKRNLKPVAEARYPRNTLQIEAGLAKIKVESPEAVIFIGTYKPFAKLVRQAKKEGLKTRFLTVSFIGTTDFIKEAGADADGVVISQVMPSISDPSTSLVNQYLKDYQREPSYGSLEGYANALVLVTALDQSGRNLTRAKFMQTLQGLNMNLGGLPLTFSAKNHQGLSRVYLTQVKNGKALPIGKL